MSGKRTPSEPYAIKTKLGWIARGVLGPDENRRTTRINFLIAEEIPLDMQFKRLWHTELYGVEGAEYKLQTLSMGRPH